MPKEKKKRNEEVIVYHRKGVKQSEIARIFGVHRSIVYRIIKRTKK